MGTPLEWIVFNAVVLVAIVLDLRVFHRHAHKVGFREAAIASFCWIGVSVLFGLGVFYFGGKQPALEFFAGYVIEKALSVDNLFLFLVIFRALGAFLVYAGIRLFFKKDEVHPEKSRMVRFLSRHLRVTREYRGADFFVRDAGRLFATPLFVVLLVVEITDVTLAMDSIPAVFGITRDPFIVYTSNVLAILGLRALYFLLAGIIDRLRFLDEGLAVVLVFIGGKMIGEKWVRVPVDTSLAVVGGVLSIALLASVLVAARSKRKEAAKQTPE